LGLGIWGFTPRDASRRRSVIAVLNGIDLLCRGGALFDSRAATGRENTDRRAGGAIDGEGKEKLPVDVDLLFHQHGFDRELAHLHFQHARRVTANIRGLPGEDHAT